MSEHPVYGQSYWEIVVHAFRKNWAARVALWISVAMILIAALTPLLANDRPYYFRGTLPGEYRRTFNGVTKGAYMQVVTLPARLREEAQKFEGRKVSQLELLRRMNDDELRAVYATRERLRKRAEGMPEIRGRWINMDVTLEEMLQVMTAEEKPAFEAARERITHDLPAAYQEKLEKTLAGFSRGLRELADQADEPMMARARELEAKFRAITEGDYLTAKEDRRPQLKEAVDEIRAAFDPEKVKEIPKTRFPLVASLSGLDVFFIVASLLALLAFGPLTWFRLRRISPLERRWMTTWMLVLVPSVLTSLLWELAHDVKFETVSYKRGVQEGAVVMSSALWPPIRYRYDEVPETTASERERPPNPPSWKHPLGTDFMGRDLVSRMLWGSRISLSIGFVSASIAITIGIILGALAGYYRGWVDIALSRVIEIMLCFPSFFIILAVVAFLPPSIFYVMLVLGIFGWMGIARLQRGEYLRLANQDFVTAAQALGATQGRVMFRHILPNALAPVLVAASFGIASAMLTESGLSFLGFGVQEPQTSWGQILFTGRSQLDKWWTFVIPGAAIFLAVTCYNLVGDGIRDAVDPRLKT